MNDSKSQIIKRFQANTLMEGLHSRSKYHSGNKIIRS